MPHLIVLGATGDVGRGVVSDGLARDWQVTAVARTADSLAGLAGTTRTDKLQLVQGSVADKTLATRLLEQLTITDDTSVAVTINTPWPRTRAPELHWPDISAYFDAYLGAHLTAAQVLIPALAKGTTYLAVGGGMADFVPSGLIPVSMAQAAARMLFRGLAKDYDAHGVLVRELLVVSMVSGRSTREMAHPSWLTDLELGRQVCDMIANPDQFDGPIHSMHSPR